MLELLKWHFWPSCLPMRTACRCRPLRYYEVQYCTYACCIDSTCLQGRATVLLKPVGSSSWLCKPACIFEARALSGLLRGGGHSIQIRCRAKDEKFKRFLGYSHQTWFGPVLWPCCPYRLNVLYTQAGQYWLNFKFYKITVVSKTQSQREVDWPLKSHLTTHHTVPKNNYNSNKMWVIAGHDILRAVLSVA